MSFAKSRLSEVIPCPNFYIVTKLSQDYTLKTFEKMQRIDIGLYSVTSLG